MRSIEISLVVNGNSQRAVTEARRPLSDFLRHDLGLTGTHVGCEQGVCGACTVLLDGVPVRSCLLLAAQAEGCSIETVEGLDVEDELSPLQQALLDSHGLQCGFCTPGLLMGLRHAEQAGLSHQEVTEQVLPGHLCRCTGYSGIREAIEAYWRRPAELPR
jgi:aerobic-type carbon monoxide dehydrogenase small subunit (CoxS/CutS family)